jgi:hypothetical protein
LGGDLDTVARAFSGLPRKQLVVLGTPGAGKSVLAMHLTLELLETRTSGAPVPVLLSISSWEPRSEHFSSWIVRRIEEDYPGLTNVSVNGRPAGHELFVSRMIIPILDGLDELAPFLPDAVAALDDALGSDAPVVVTCRADKYEEAVKQGGRLLSSAAVVEIDPIAPEEVVAYLESFGSRGRWATLADHVRAAPDGALATALSTPLMVWLLRTGYATPQDDPEELLDRDRFQTASDIETRLLDRLITSVYEPRPQPTGASARPTYHAHRAEIWLRCIATGIDAGPDDRPEGAPGTGDIAWWRLYRALPRWQLAAMVLAGAIPTLVVPAFTIVGLSVGFTRARFLATVAALAVGILGAMIVSPLIPPPPPGRVTFRLPKASALVRPTVMLYSAIAGLTVAISTATAATVLRDLAVGGRFGLTAGSLASVAVYLVAILNGPVDVIQAASPSTVLRDDRRVAGLTGLLVGCAIGGVTVHGGGGWMGVGAGFCSGIATGAGMTSWGRYQVARCWLAAQGRLPWRLMRFLNDAYERGVLRRAGTVFQFRHARLQRHLASRLDS